MKKSWLLPIILLLNGYAEAQIHIVKVNEWLYLEYPVTMDLEEAIKNNNFWNESVRTGHFVYCLDFDRNKITYTDEAGAVNEYAISRTSSMDSLVECDYRTPIDGRYRTFRAFPSNEQGKYMVVMFWTENQVDGTEKQCCMLSQNAERY